jgi:hypothetical protein
LSGSDSDCFLSTLYDSRSESSSSSSESVIPS